MQSPNPNHGDSTLSFLENYAAKIQFSLLDKKKRCFKNLNDINLTHRESEDPGNSNPQFFKFK